MSCEVCDHSHDHMAVVYKGKEVIELCHEDDHSCYEAWEDPERSKEILRRALRFVADPGAPM